MVLNLIMRNYITLIRKLLFYQALCKLRLLQPTGKIVENSSDFNQPTNDPLKSQESDRSIRNFRILNALNYLIDGLESI